MRTKCITKLCKAMKTNIIAIRLSDDCIDAYRFLQSKKINPAKLLRNGGENLVIDTAKKNRFKVKTIRDMYPNMF